LIREVVREDDPRLEPYRHVGDPHWLRERDLFVAEGRLVVARLFELGHAVHSVLATPTAQSALGSIASADCPVYVAPQAILNTVTGFKFHRGCLALARRLASRPLDSFANAHRLVVLEGVGNPDNVGGIFRGAAALAADGVILSQGSADPLYRKAVRTSMGAALRLPFAIAEDWPGALTELRRMGFVVAALSPSGAVTLDEFAASVASHPRIALLAGAEGPGLSPAASSAADRTVRIPVDSRSDSLNVVVAVAIALQRLRA
jgi:tRNA G18 (ribose-2'-O)-methylase SpoU